MSRRDYCRKKSRRWHHWNKTLKRSKRKCSGQTWDFQHKLSRKIVDNTKANTIIVGDLNVKGMVQSARATAGLNRSTQNNGYLGRFVRFLSYKSEFAGKRFVEIDESNTSKRCFACGKLYDMPLWVRVMRCDCGNVIDRDKNSSVNIMARFLSQFVLWMGYSQFESNLRNTGLPALRLEVHSQEAYRSR